MADTFDSLVSLANECEDHANALQAIQKNLGYQGPDIVRLHANEMTLRTKVLVLNTAAVGAALSSSMAAQSQLKEAIVQAKKVTKIVRDVQLAIQIAGDLVSLAGGIVSDNPAVIIAAAAQTIADAATPAPG